jgi:hypothetical protein
VAPLASNADVLSEYLSHFGTARDGLMRRRLEDGHVRRQH